MPSGTVKDWAPPVKVKVHVTALPDPCTQPVGSAGAATATPGASSADAPTTATPHTPLVYQRRRVFVC
jgi:hypothetical protein